MEIQLRNRIFFKISCGFLLLFYSLCTFALSPPGVSGNQATGDYTVSYNATVSYPTIFIWLQEKVGSGPWTTVSDPVPLGTVDFSNKANGVYQYRVAELADSYSYPYFPTFSWSTAVTVIVDGSSGGAGSSSSSMDYSTQSTYSYEVRKGDVNADGLQDLYVKRSSGGSSNNGVLYETLLQQQSDSTFTVMQPDAAQQMIGASWPMISVDVESADFNLDGFTDIIINGLENHIAGVAKQLIFSSGSGLLPQASVVSSLGPYMHKTMTNIAGSFSNPNYFDPYMAQVPLPVPVWVCGISYNYYFEGFSPGCWIQIQIVIVTVYDANFVTQEGISFAHGWGNLGEVTSDAEFRNNAEYVYDVVATILGINVGEDRPDFNNQGAVEEVLAKIWVILSSLCGEANVSDCVPVGSGAVSESASNHLKGALNCIDQLALGQAPLPFTGNPFRTPKVPHSSTQNFAITSSQLSYSNGSTDSARRNFWLSRFNASKDPLGPLGVNVVDNAYLLGCLANQRTLLYANDYGQVVSLTSIGLDMMEEHVDAVSQDNDGIFGKLSASQIRDYHVVVFNRFGLPPQTFGGAPFKGTAFEAEKSKFLWCPSCE